MGQVIGDGKFALGATASLVAIVKDGNVFLSWQDGNTDNPRSVVVTKDSLFTAQFSRSEVLPLKAQIDSLNEQITSLKSENIEYQRQVAFRDSVILALQKQIADLQAELLNATSIHQIDAFRLDLYPNPVQEKLTIHSDVPIQKFEIYSLTGELLLVEVALSDCIDLSHLPVGAYMSMIYTDRGVIVRKIEKE